MLQCPGCKQPLTRKTDKNRYICTTGGCSVRGIWLMDVGEKEATTAKCPKHIGFFKDTCPECKEEK